MKVLVVRVIVWPLRAAAGGLSAVGTNLVPLALLNAFCPGVTADPARQLLGHGCNLTTSAGGRRVSGPGGHCLGCEPGRLFASVSRIHRQLSLAIADRSLNRLTDVLGFHLTQNHSKVVDPPQNVSLLLHQLPRLSRRRIPPRRQQGLDHLSLDLLTRSRLSTLEGPSPLRPRGKPRQIVGASRSPLDDGEPQSGVRVAHWWLPLISTKVVRMDERERRLVENELLFVR